MKLLKFIIPMILAFMLILFCVWMRQPKPQTSPALPSALHTEFEQAHPCYRNSVVMCGAWTPKAAGFSHGRAEYATEDTLYYTSYRVGPDTFWSKKPVLVKKYELMWTDGKRLVRARCGNELSKTPKVPVQTAVAVSVEDLDKTIETPMVQMPGVVYQSTLYVPPVEPPTASAPPTGGDPGFPGPPIGTPGCYGCGVVVSTPEGDSKSFFVIGMLVMIAVLLIKTRKA